MRFLSGARKTGDRFALPAQNGMFVDPSGAHYETEWEAYWGGALGMCACGCPEQGMVFVQKVLATCKRDSPQWVDAQSAIAKLVRDEPDVVAEILLHWLNSRGALDHGGTVGGSFLEPLGREILSVTVD